jgi:hypothetical protein
MKLDSVYDLPREDHEKMKTMRPPWSMPAVITLTMLAQACVAAAAAAAEARTGVPSTNTDSFAAASLLLAAAGGTSEAIIQQAQQWLTHGYERAPALMLGLAALLAVPPLALAGLVISRRKPHPDATIVLNRRQRTRSSRRTTLHTEISPWPTEAWVEADGIPGGRRVIGRTMVRIGREDDNDIRFAVKTVHRYHAVIRRTTDGVVMITDVSGKDGNGVLVNGARVAEARLAKGDVINLGEVKMRFDARPV